MGLGDYAALYTIPDAKIQVRRESLVESILALIWHIFWNHLRFNGGGYHCLLGLFTLSKNDLCLLQEHRICQT